MLKNIYHTVCQLNLSFLGHQLHVQGNGPKKVCYDLADGSDPQHYPLLLVPQQGTDIVMPKKGKNCKKGLGEQWFALWIWTHRLKGFYDNLMLPASGHRYEPDLAYIDEQRGIYIDIENDEPYSMSKRVPTHYIGKDDERNRNITSAGWIVLRFSEQQFIDTPASVARTVMNVVCNIAPEVEMPKCLRDVSPVEPDPCWDYDTARDRAKTRYRDTYMNKHLIFRLAKSFILKKDSNYDYYRK